MITKDTSVQALFDAAVMKLNEVNEGEVFIVRDLFCGVDWKRIPIGKRIKLGSLFLVYAENTGSNMIRPINGEEAKTSQGQQRYTKIS